MIPDAGTGRGFQGYTRYCMVGEKDNPNPDRVSFFEAHNLPTDCPYTNAAIMYHTARKSRAEDPMFKFSIAWPPDEQPSIETQREVARDILERYEVRDKRGYRGAPDEMKPLSEYQAQVFGHDDTEHAHFHVAVNLVHPETGRAGHVGLYKNRLRDVCTEIEQERGWRVVTHDREDHDSRELQRNEKMKLRREGIQPELRHLPKADAITLKKELAEGFKAAQSWDELERVIGVHNLTIQPKGQGYILTDGEAYAKLSEMGKANSMKRLEQRFGLFAEYVTEREETRAAVLDEQTMAEKVEAMKRKLLHQKEQEYNKEM